MSKRGFSMYFIPSFADPGTYVYRGVLEQIDETRTMSTTPVFYGKVEVDQEWMEAAPVDQFIAVCVELISQIMFQRAPVEVEKSMKDNVAQVVREMETLSLTDSTEI